MSQPLPAPVVDDLAPHDHDPYANRPIRWGFIGAGRIAGALAEAIAHAEGNELVAVAARDPQRAGAFAQTWNATSWYGSYADLVEDPDVDVVYINTTHPYHREQALLAIRAGKHILVEKPFALNAAEATEMFDEARAAGVFAMEAMWMRTQPLIRAIEGIVAAGEIGDLVKVGVDFPVPFPYDPDHRLFDLANGGGALLDLGVYASTLAWLFLGRPDTVHVMGSLAPTGADQVVAMQWGYDNGAIAQIYCTSQGAGPIRANILGRNGWVTIEPPFSSGPTTAIVHVGGFDDADERVLQVPTLRYVHEVDEVARCLREGLLESPLVPQEDTVGILEILDAARSELGVVYPQERV
jgi:predicted dehydrogenase